MWGHAAARKVTDVNRPLHSLRNGGAAERVDKCYAILRQLLAALWWFTQ